jgi:hypothetical protein
MSAQAFFDLAELLATARVSAVEALAGGPLALDCFDLQSVAVYLGCPTEADKGRTTAICIRQID